MTTAQLNGMRKLHEATTAPERTKSAREMALTSHDLSHDSYHATTNDGQRWAWDDSRCLWVAV